MSAAPSSMGAVGDGGNHGALGTRGGSCPKVPKPNQSLPFLNLSLLAPKGSGGLFSRVKDKHSLWPLVSVYNGLFNKDRVT